MGKGQSWSDGFAWTNRALQLDANPQAHIGDEVVLLGKQGEERISAEELGQRWGTINYEVVCGLANRLPRLYF